MSRDSLPPVILHDSARILGENPLTIETSPQPWAYAARFAIETPDADDGVVHVRVELEVVRGQVGIGLLNRDGTAFNVERFAEADDGSTVLVLTLRPGQSSDTFIVRNGISGGAAVVRIRSLHVDVESRWVDPTITISSGTFAPFLAFDGPVPPGFWVNWLGVITRADVWPFPPEVRASYEQPRRERCERPLTDEHVLDWAPLLDAVLSSHDVFRIVALGAGWGRWLTAGAFAARQRGLTYELTGVEAEPDHYAWMQQHMTDNHIPPDCCRLIRGAAAASTDPSWFPAANPGWYGQSIVAATRVQDVTGDQIQVVVDGMQLRRVRSVPIEEVLLDGNVVDYLHMDIQGTEYEFLSRDPQRLDALVRTINIGTHSEVIERRLRALFTRLGWAPLYDVGIGTSAQIVLDGATVARVEFGDGVQVWRNPRLSL